MEKPNRERKGEIKYNITLNNEQIEAKRLILDNQIVIITGQAGSGKTLVAAQTALDCLNKKMCDRIFLTRSLIELGESMGYLPGSKEEKLSPYLEAIMDNFEKCMDTNRIQTFLSEGKIKAGPIQFMRGKTVEDMLIVDEVQNTTPHEIEAILTRLGKTGKIILTGDSAQRDTNTPFTGLDFAINLSKNIPEIKWIKLKENHRSDLVGKILDFIYNKK